MSLALCTYYPGALRFQTFTKTNTLLLCLTRPWDLSYSSLPDILPITCQYVPQSLEEEMPSSLFSFHRLCFRRRNKEVKSFYRSSYQSIS